MVLVYLNDGQKEKITVLNKFEESIVNEFCRISIESIQKEINAKTLNAASQKLDIDVKELKELIELLSWIMLEFSRLDSNEKEIRESLQLASVKSDLIETILAHATNNLNQLKHYLSNLKLQPMSYDDLEWRVDFKLASRSLRKICEPEIMIKLDLNSSNSQNKQIVTHLLQTDVTNLANLTSSLEEALNEIKSNHVRRIFRNIV